MIFFLLASGCAGFPVKRAGRDVSRRFFVKTSPSYGFIGSIIFNGQVSCGDSGYPFIMGASIGSEKLTLHFYSYSGEILFRANQVRDGSERRMRMEEPVSDRKSELAHLYRILKNMGAELSIRGIVSGKAAFENRKGELFQTRRGYLYEGETFRLVTDREMRLSRADYRVDESSIKVSYVYAGEEEIPSAIRISSFGCVFDLDVEQLIWEGRGDG